MIKNTFYPPHNLINVRFRAVCIQLLGAASMGLITTNAQAQVWNGSTVATQTSDDVSVQTTSTQGSVSIGRSDLISNSGSNTYTYPKPALSILQYRPYSNFSTGFNGTATNSPQNIFEIMRPSYSNGSGGTSMGAFLGYNSPIFTIGEQGGMCVNGPTKAYFANAIYGSTYFDAPALFRAKMRLTSDANTISSLNWSANTSFPYTFSVDNGDSRFMGKVEINGDLIIRGNNLLTTGNNEIKFSSDGIIRAREVIIDYDLIPDYVFKPNYKLMPLSELEMFIKRNYHLPKIKSESEYNQLTGIEIGELNLKLLEKVEELTLYIIELQKQIDQQKKFLEQLNK